MKISLETRKDTGVYTPVSTPTFMSASENSEADTTKQVIVGLSPQEHKRLKKIAKMERRTLGQQLAYMALQNPEALKTLETMESAGRL